MRPQFKILVTMGAMPTAGLGAAVPASAPSTLTPMSDFGSRMGAARLGQAASDAVSVTVCRLLTCADAVTWPGWPVEH
jgi:hypothetical protein